MASAKEEGDDEVNDVAPEENDECSKDESEDVAR